MKLVDEGESFLRINCRGRASDILMTVTGALAWLAVLAVFLYKYLSYEGEIAYDAMPVPMLIAVPLSVVGILFSAMFFVRQMYGKRIIFDGKTRTVTIIRLFSRDTVMSFESVARVALISIRTLLFKREAYCLVPTIAPVFGVKIISPIYKSGGAKIEKFKSDVVPKIESILELEEINFVKAEETPHVPRGYKCDGTRYTKSFVCRNIFWIILCAFDLFAASCSIMGILNSYILAKNNAGFFIITAMLTLIAGASLFFLLQRLFVQVSSISFDTQRQIIRVRRGVFGYFGTKQYKTQSLKSFDVRGYLEGWGGRRSLYLKLEDVKKPVQVIYLASRGKEAADEVKFLSWFSGLDPARDTTYTLHIKYISLFEVP